MYSTNECSMNFRLRMNMAIIVLIAVFLIALFGIVGTRVIAESTSATMKTDDIIVVYEDDTSTSAIKKQLDANDSSTDDIAKVDSDTKFAVADVPDDQTVNQTIKQYEKSSIVEYAQPNYKYKALSYSGGDSYYSKLWCFSNIGVIDASRDYSAITALTSKSKIKVAVLDTGLSVSHSDLQACVNKSLSVDIVNDYTKLTSDDDGHGTHVAGIVGATADNNLGIAGVGSSITGNNISIIAEDVFDGDYAYDSDIINGIYYAVENGAKVINMSLGGASDYSYGETFNETPALETALNYCESSGVTVVCAAGNDGDNSDAEKINSPGDYDTCISVTATDSDNNIAYYSSYNEYKDIAAPGGNGYTNNNYVGNIYSTLPANTYGYEAGTSMASPVVAGVVAAMYSINSNLTVSQVKSYLYSSATDLGTSGRDDYYGNGLVNADKAVLAVAEAKYGTLNTLTFNVNGGTSTSVTNAKIGTNKTVSSLPVGKWSKYKLVGWYTTANSGTKLTTSTVIIGDQTYYAHWSKVKVSKAALSSVKSKSKKIYVVTKTVSGANGYRLRYSKYKSFKKSKYITKTSRKITTGKLIKNKYYYVKVRAYKLDSTKSKIYGSWSSAKKIKVKS